MNRMICYLSLNGSVAGGERLKSCQFQTPHWQPDHEAMYIQSMIAMSAMQRFITPECETGLMPFQHQSSGFVINADVYLTNRERLCELLECDLKTADAVLILRAYLKWGERCTRYLSGVFGFMIWDPRHQHLFVAVDQFAQAPLFYAYQPDKFCILANECSPFHTLMPQLNLKVSRLIAFAKDEHSATETAYHEIQKLPAGHQLIITTKGLIQTCYWRWKDQRQTRLHQTREEYYDALQHHFKHAVDACLRRQGALTTQISGGLDSSAVTAQAASLLGKQHQSLYAFTSIPHGLAGESYRSGWYYHELDRIQKLVAQFPNIQHVVYKATLSTDIFEKLKPLQRCFDQPLRNINNLDWTLATYEQALANQGRLLLIGAGGNGTISWAGSSPSETIIALGAAIKAKILFRSYRWTPRLHETMLSGRTTAPLRASVYPIQLWYGVRRLDPTQELDLAIFCYNVPQWVYRRGKLPLQRRLLTREGLRKLLPEAITQNPYRGEQGADWYLHYNLHCDKWRYQLLTLTDMAQGILWQCYDRQKIMKLFDVYPYLEHPPDRNITHDLCHYLLRCVSLGSFLNEHTNNA